MTKVKKIESDTVLRVACEIQPYIRQHSADTSFKEMKVFIQGDNISAPAHFPIIVTLVDPGKQLHRTPTADRGMAHVAATF